MDAGESYLQMHPERVAAKAIRSIAEMVAASLATLLPT
jgi:hypothetical protein